MKPSIFSTYKTTADRHRIKVLKTEPHPEKSCKEAIETLNTASVNQSFEELKETLTKPLTMRTKISRLELNKVTKDISLNNSTKVSKRSYAEIASFAVISTKGNFRSYNEDRVSIVNDVKQPDNFQGSSWPKVSFFGIYDGHGGTFAANFLRDNLHKYVFDDMAASLKPHKALLNAFTKCENEIMSIAEKSNEKSGSCALVMLVVDNRIYLANTGDSRAIMSV